MILVLIAVLGRAVTWAEPQTPKIPKAASRSNRDLARLRRASKSPESWHSAEWKLSVDLLNITCSFLYGPRKRILIMKIHIYFNIIT